MLIISYSNKPVVVPSHPPVNGSPLTEDGTLIPGVGDREDIDNIFVTFDENKGGVAEFEPFESDDVPTAKDFCYQSGDVGTPDGDWDFVSKVYFKGKELDVYDHLDNRGKASTVEIYRKNHPTIT